MVGHLKFLEKNRTGYLDRPSRSARGPARASKIGALAPSRQRKLANPVYGPGVWIDTDHLSRNSTYSGHLSPDQPPYLYSIGMKE